MDAPLLPGQLLARGVCRHLVAQGLACLTEFVPTRGMRVDVMALDRRGRIWIVECKSSRADFQSDRKWAGYLDWCDRYFWAVDTAFPDHLLPSGTGINRAEAYDAEFVVDAPETPRNAARRKALTLRFARAGALRTARLLDPGLAAVEA